MGKKPDFKVVKHDGNTADGKRSTVSRTSTGNAAVAKRHEHRAGLERGSSDWFTVEGIKHRK